MTQDLTQKAYQHIYDRLSSGKLKPGSRLSNRSVAKEIGISFTPVRVAFSRLVSEGLLEHRQGVGVFVPMVSIQEVRESYEFREFLESEAAARACKDPSPIMLAEMAECLKIMEDIYEKTLAAEDGVTKDSYTPAWLDADLAFHMSLLRSIGNRRIIDTVLGLRTSLTVLKTSLRAIIEDLPQPPESVGEQIANESQGHLKRTLDEHRRILEALKLGDAEAARSLMAEHIQSGLKLTLTTHSRTCVTSATSHLQGPHTRQ